MVDANDSDQCSSLYNQLEYVSKERIDRASTPMKLTLTMILLTFCTPDIFQILVAVVHNKNKQVSKSPNFFISSTR